MKKEKYVWVTIFPTIFLFITCMTAGWQKISSSVFAGFNISPRAIASENLFACAKKPIFGFSWKIFCHPKIGFLAQANRFSDAIARGEILKPAKTLEEMQTIGWCRAC
jgi:carbon starvation protein